MGRIHKMSEQQKKELENAMNLQAEVKEYFDL